MYTIRGFHVHGSARFKDSCHDKGHDFSNNSESYSMTQEGLAKNVWKQR